MQLVYERWTSYEVRDSYHNCWLLQPAVNAVRGEDFVRSPALYRFGCFVSTGRLRTKSNRGPSAVRARTCRVKNLQHSELLCCGLGYPLRTKMTPARALAVKKHLPCFFGWSAPFCRLLGLWHVRQRTSYEVLRSARYKQKNFCNQSSVNMWNGKRSRPGVRQGLQIAVESSDTAEPVRSGGAHHRTVAGA
jgi:hypothetical protein